MDRQNNSSESLRILHVDDDQTQLEMLSIIFGHLDSSIVVESCESPFEALKKIAENGFDCIVSDYLMPKMSGIKLAERTLFIKKIPFILYTGQGSEEVAQKAFSVGIDSYIRKEIEPSHYEVLLNSIRQTVTKHRAEQVYEAVLDSNPEAILVVRDGLIQLANPDAISLFDYSDLDGLIGKRFHDFIEDFDHDDFTWMSLRQIVSENSVIPFEFSIKTELGKKRVMGRLRNMSYMGDASQIFFIKDVSVSRRLEASLLSLNHWFDKLFELSPTGVAFISLSGGLVRSNSAFRDLLGLRPNSRANLLQEPELNRKINNRIMKNDSLCLECDLDLLELTKEGYLESSFTGSIEVSMILSPVIDPSLDDLFLMQVHPIISPNIPFQ